MTSCQTELALLWSVGWVVLFVIFLLQSVFGHYGENWEGAWGWFLSATMPTLSLIEGVLRMDATGMGVEERQVTRFFFRLTFALSVVYLLTVSSAILLQPLASLPPLELLRQYNDILGVFQGLVGGALGAFFLKAEPTGG